MAVRELKRRKFFGMLGGIAFLSALPGKLKARYSRPANVRTVPGSIERLAPDWGYYSSRSGPIRAVNDDLIFWITTDPEAPYLSKSMRHISRLTLHGSRDQGKTWYDMTLLDKGTEHYSVMSFVLWKSHSGTLIHIYARSGGYDYATGSPEKSLRETFFQRSFDNGNTWSQPQKLQTGERYHGDVLSIEETRSGRLIYPFCFLTNVRSQFAVSVMYSDDEGQSWVRSRSVLTVGGGGFESGASEPTVVELKNGRLWMLLRAQTGYLWEAFSDDRGETWSESVQSRLPSSNAPANLLRLRDGTIAIAWNPHISSNYARQSIVIGLTEDGKSFQGLREFDYTDFTDNPNASIPHVTYPFITEANDGMILVAYNKGNWSRHNRPTLARIHRNWIKEKKHVINFENGRTGWHTIDPGPRKDFAVEKYVQSLDHLCLEMSQHSSNSNPTGVVRSIPMIDDGIIEVKCQIIKSEACILLSNSLLSPRIIDDGVLRIRFSHGQVFLAAGKEKRIQNNRKSTTYSYASQQILDEIKYPLEYGESTLINTKIRYNTGAKKATISINDGPKVELNTSEIIGLLYIGLTTFSAGVIRLYSIISQKK